MKRILIIMSLAALVMPLILVGCGGGTTLTESDKATIRGYGTRLDDHDTDIGNIRAVTNKLDEDTLATLMALAALDADELAALLDLDLNTALSDIEKLKTDVGDINDPDKADSLADVVARVGELENGQPDGSTPPVITGQVTAVFYPGQPAIVSGSGLPIQQFNVVITNGTANWQYVSYSLIFTCKVSPPLTGATVANLTGVTPATTSMVLNTVFGTSLAFTPNFVTNPSGNVTQITFYPNNGIAAAPGTSSSSILNYLNFNLPSGVAIQEWNCIIIPVYSTSNW